MDKKRYLIYIVLAIPLGGCANNQTTTTMTAQDYKHMNVQALAAAREGRLLEGVAKYQHLTFLIMIGLEKGDPVVKDLGSSLLEFTPAPFYEDLKNPANIDQAVILLKVSPYVAPEFHNITKESVGELLGFGLNAKISDENLIDFYKNNKSNLRWDPEKNIFVVRRHG